MSNDKNQPVEAYTSDDINTLILAERERCARIVEQYVPFPFDSVPALRQGIAAAIRSWK